MIRSCNSIEQCQRTVSNKFDCRVTIDKKRDTSFCIDLSIAYMSYPRVNTHLCTCTCLFKFDRSIPESTRSVWMTSGCRRRYNKASCKVTQNLEKSITFRNLCQLSSSRQIQFHNNIDVNVAFQIWKWKTNRGLTLPSISLSIVCSFDSQWTLKKKEEKSRLDFKIFRIATRSLQVKYFKEQTVRFVSNFELSSLRAPVFNKLAVRWYFISRNAHRTPCSSTS